ncbi:hypothetical protein [Rhizobium sullae]|uniref:Uncharacterized protein n=1 Tax=Rhizobium sullae TaxID=50338 RepID=A0A2N0D7Y0_RHISU|nr:hypothetical protein [Rhizobium sullae]PKA42213.1 hypothetical protein CWR43_19100 [Rhizobium sullae]UWU18278.1 hypothetical protein N2599_23810 [Rhizobium sullae]
MQKPPDKDDVVEGRQNMRPPEMDLEPIPTDTKLEDQGSSGLDDPSDTLHDPSPHERSAGFKRSDRKGSRQEAEERVEGLPDTSLDERSIVSTPPALD